MCVSSQIDDHRRTMSASGLSNEALNSAVTDLCQQATAASCRGHRLHAQLLLDQAATLMERRRFRSSAPREAPVVVIDDDRDIREEVGAALSEMGYSVLCFANGEEALRHLRTDPSAALILLDLMMPVMDGWTFHEEAGDDHRLAGIPVIVMSASRHRAPPASAAILHKPVRRHALLAIVEQTLAAEFDPEGRRRG
jgi:CheY-like chemotaxis protein